MNPNTSSSKQQIIQGHSRPIKDIKFSQNGEMIYTASVDRNVISWNVLSGEKAKTYPHSAAVNIIQLTKDYMITGDNTGCVYIWDTQGGVLLKQIEQDPTLCVRSISLSTDDSLLLILYAGRMKGAKSFINVYRLQDILDYKGDSKEEEIINIVPPTTYSNKSGMMKAPVMGSIPKAKPIVIEENCTAVIPIKTFECKSSETKYVQAKFAISDKSIIVSREDGYLELINFSNGKIITENKFHNDIILDFDLNTEHSLILTASRDGTACVINFDTFQTINKFHPQNPTRNLNACTIAVVPNPEYEKSVVVNTINDVNVQMDANLNLNGKRQPQQEILKLDIDNFFSGSEDLKESSKKIKKEFIIAVLSGGQDSKLVTTTNQKEGGFEIIMYEALEGYEMANYLTHFGPVNTLAAMKNILASGAEDATVRLYNVENYLFPIDKNK
jgi:WD40 repeat protein